MSSENFSVTPPHCRVLIADDHRIVRTSLRCLLETNPDITVVADAQDGEEALLKIGQFLPDVALVDVNMPKLSGLEVIRRATAEHRRTKIITLTALEEGSLVRDALAAGAAGFVPKAAAAEDLISAIRAVTSGEFYVHPRSAVPFISAVTQPPPTEGLSAREAEILRLIAFGYSNKEIANQLSLSVKTVETYKARGMEKISASSRVALIQYAITHGWLTTSQTLNDVASPARKLSR